MELLLCAHDSSFAVPYMKSSHVVATSTPSHRHRLHVCQVTSNHVADSFGKPLWEFDSNSSEHFNAIATSVFVNRDLHAPSTLTRNIDINQSIDSVLVGDAHD